MPTTMARIRRRFEFDEGGRAGFDSTGDIDIEDMSVRVSE